MEMLSGKRRGKIPTQRSLENVALFYLSHYAASAFSLRRVLENRLRRAAMQNPLFARDGALRSQLQDAIDQIIEKHKKTGVLNDAAYAELKTAAWRSKGRSARAIRQRLGQSGVASAIAEQALRRESDEDGEETEFRAALTLARRRKLGPFRKNKDDADRRDRDLAALARAGFSLAIARRVLGAKYDSCDNES